ncbi:hypothetical protein ScPMuIL_005779 [Solemya velum]
MMNGKKCPQILRGLRILTEKPLHSLLECDFNETMTLDEIPSSMAGESKTAKYWVDCLGKGVLIMMMHIREEKEGNLMVLFAIVRSSRLRSMTNFFLANLAVADLCVGIFCVLPNLSIFLSAKWVLGRIMCKVYYFVWHMSYTASITILSAIATERYLAIIHPLKARRFITYRKLKIAQAIIWFVAAGYNVPYLIIFDTVNLGPTAAYCFPKINLIDMKAMSASDLVVWYAVPLCMMIYMYSRISITLWKSTRSETLQLRSTQETRDDTNHTGDSRIKPKTDSSGSSTRHKKHRIMNGSARSNTEAAGTPPTPDDSDGLQTSTPDPQRATQKKNYNAAINSGKSDTVHNKNCSKTTNRTTHKNVNAKKTIRGRVKVIRLLVAVVISFAICVLPHHIRLLLHYWHISFSSPGIELLSPISFIILYLNSALNPILYALFSDHFRKSFKESISCRRRKRHFAVSQENSSRYGNTSVTHA